MTLGNGIEEIKDNAFPHYEGLNQELVIGDNVQTIGISALSSFNGIKLTIGSGVSSIGMYAFDHYNGHAYINMIEIEFNNVTKGEGWINPYHATIHFFTLIES